MPVITITLQDSAVRAVFQKLADSSKDMRPVLAKIGQELCESTRRRFDASVAPDGTPWKALSKSTRRGREKRKPLFDTGGLRRSFSFRVSGSTLSVGTNYLTNKIPSGVAIHQFGGTINIPARTQKVRLRTNADGSLTRQKSSKTLAVFARQGIYGHKRYRETTHRVEAYQVIIPVRPFLGISSADREMISREIEHYLFK